MKVSTAVIGVGNLALGIAFGGVAYLFNNVVQATENAQGKPYASQPENVQRRVDGLCKEYVAAGVTPSIQHCQGVQRTVDAANMASLEDSQAGMYGAGAFALLMGVGGVWTAIRQGRRKSLGLAR